jgi:hypothetical protein
MSNFKVRGVISKIGEAKQLDNGATVMDYVVESTSDNGYVTKYPFGMYKKPEYAEHIVNFGKFNKVGDVVEVEFTIRSSEGKDGRMYPKLNHWKCDKVEMSVSDAVTPVTNEANDLPF